MTVNIDLVRQRLSDELGLHFKSMCDALRYAYLTKEWSATQIALATGGEASLDTILKLLRRCKIQVRKRGGPNYRGRRVHFTEEEWLNTPTKLLARKYNMSTEGIRRLARRYKYPKKQGGWK